MIYLFKRDRLCEPMPSYFPTLLFNMDVSYLASRDEISSFHVYSRQC